MEIFSLVSKHYLQTYIGTINRCAYLLARQEYSNTYPVFENTNLSVIDEFNTLYEKYKKLAIDVASDTLIETHYYPLKKAMYTKDTEYIGGRIHMNVNACYWSIIVQDCNFKYIMEKLGHNEYNNYQITPKDLEHSIRQHTSTLCDSSCKHYYEAALKTLFSSKDCVKHDIFDCVRLKRYLDITYVMDKIEFDWRSLLDNLVEHKSFMQIYTFHTSSKNKQSSHLMTYDGFGKLPISEYHREMLTKYYKYNHKEFAKFIEELLSPSMPRKGINVNGDEIGYQYLFDLVRQYNCRHKDLEEITEEELFIFKINFKEYIETCRSIWGDQSEAIKYIHDNMSRLCDLNVIVDNKDIKDNNKENTQQTTITIMSQVETTDTVEVIEDTHESLKIFRKSDIGTAYQELNEVKNETKVKELTPEEIEDLDFFAKLALYE